jgi:hypothetical protein
MHVTRKQEGFFHSERNNLSQYDKQCIMDNSFLQTRYWGLQFLTGWYGEMVNHHSEVLGIGIFC